ncbi:MAG: heme exporter protein CcmD [Rhodospirillales bacterium]|nr:heme exporter protein CcmD [Rhodospirillales bacterium]
MAEFLSMGGYGSFICSAFGLSAVVLIGILIQSQRFLKTSEAELNSLQPEDTSDGVKA